MKKRSLVAAIAMLVVSAIVLTSSTYAWFSASSSASVDYVTASVSNSNGTITLTPTGANALSSAPSVSLASTDWALPSKIKPVSMSGYAASAATMPTFKKCDYNGLVFSSASDATGGSATVDSNDYVMYQFQVNHKNASTSAATVTMTINYSTTGTYTYGAVIVDSATAAEDRTELFGDGDSYHPLLGIASGTIDDVNSNCIIDSNDKYTGTSNAPTASDLATTTISGGQLTKNITLNSPASTATNGTTWTVTVFIWAEGQDQHCTGTANASSGTFNFSFGVTTAESSSASSGT